MDISTVGIPVVATLYLIGLLLLLRKLIVHRREKKPTDRRLVALAIIGGTVLGLLIVAKLVYG